ncbi:MAG: hypothetical protein IT324_31715 [Anaerolineae bacterium]|nr:hypothetical protein [Anaerolineae bacterium]
MLDGYITRYLAQFKIDPSTLGGLAGQGTQHYIYAYQKNKIIKIPKTSLMIAAFGKMTSDDVRRDIGLLQRYMPEYLVNTEVLCADNGCYVVIQDILRGPAYIAYDNFPLIKDDFEKIVEANQCMVRDHCLTLDLLGNIGSRRCMLASLLRRKQLAFMNNLLIVRQGESYTLKVVDINLIPTHYRCNNGIGKLRALIDSLYYQLSRFLIRDNFGVAF